VRRSLSQLGESRNVFYEQELIKREEEILQLRMSNRMAEFKTRDLEVLNWEQALAFHNSKLRLFSSLCSRKTSSTCRL